MSSKEFKVHFIYNNKNHRVELGYPEIQALLFLNEHTFLSQPQLYEFFSFVHLVHPATFRKKTSKWLEAGLIKKKSLQLQNGHSVVIISLAGAGLSVLKKLKYIKEKARIKSTNIRNIDHSLAIRQVVLDVIANHREQNNAQIYYAKDLYFIGIQPDVFFFTSTEPATIYKSMQLGKDNINHFKPYRPVQKFEKALLTLLTSINPYREKDEHTEVIADWLFELQGQFLHVEIDCGNEQIRKSKSIHDTSFEGKLSRLQPQLHKKEIDPSNYHVLFIIVDNREDTVLTQNHPKRLTRISNVKQEIPLFPEFKQWEFEIDVIQFSRARSFIENFFRKLAEPITEESDLIDELIEVFSQKKELQFSDWEFFFTEKNNDTLKDYTFHPDGYIPEKVFYYKHTIHKNKQFIIPFFMSEGDVKTSEHLAHLAARVGKGYYGGQITKILVIYPTENQLKYDVLRKTQKNSKDTIAMDTSKMLFISMTNFITKFDTPKIYNESKKQIPYNSIFEL
ncbi:hypothetical protein NYE67_16630 [Solibacillus sp. FSL W8-0474]|uniref:hypothetical protein n=1 Tax=Solibacillus sp. FSL W8-0474 TaxID=2975336 RepID=UPI0030F4F670